MKSAVFGYIRVSDKDQNEERQRVAMLEAGVHEDNIFIDKKSGKNFNRPEYKFLLENRLGEGDLLVVTSIDRLGRNYNDIMEQWRHITLKLKANVRVLDMPLLDTSVNTQTLDSRFVADLVLQILSYVAEKERENIRKRQREGIDVMPVVDGKRVSSKTNRPTGRPKAQYPVGWSEVYDEWKAKKITAKVAMEKLNLKRNTFYNLVKAHEKGIEEVAPAPTKAVVIQEEMEPQEPVEAVAVEANPEPKGAEGTTIIDEETDTRIRAWS